MIYEYKCRNGHEFERVLPVADYKTRQKCKCGAEGKRILSLPTLNVSRDICYDSPIDGKPITTMAKRREDLARSGCQPYDPEMKKDTDRKLRQDAERLEKSVDATVEEVYEKLPPKKKERLANELLGGVGVEPTRATPAAQPISVEIKHG